MFSGIIESTGVVKGFAKGKLTLDIGNIGEDIAIGESVAVDGVCLTVSSFDKKAAVFSVMPETLRRTTFDAKKIGHLVNIERALPANGRISGHFVQGHVDCLARLVRKVKEKDAWLMHFEIPREFLAYVVEKGSVAINGISLTIAGVARERSSFWVGVIPHTWTQTNLQYLKTGDKVNVEVDIIAKYLYHFIHNSHK